MLLRPRCSLGVITRASAYPLCFTSRRSIASVPLIRDRHVIISCYVSSVKLVKIAYKMRLKHRFRRSLAFNRCLWRPLAVSRRGVSHLDLPPSGALSVSAIYLKHIHFKCKIP